MFLFIIFNVSIHFTVYSYYLLEEALSQISSMVCEQIDSVQRDLDGLEGSSRTKSKNKKRPRPTSAKESKKQRLSPIASQMISSEAHEDEGEGKG